MEVEISLPGTLSHLSNHYSITEKVYWGELLRDILKSKYNYLFEGDLPKDYIALYLNGTKLDSLKDVKLSNSDSLNILSAISGG